METSTVALVRHGDKKKNRLGVELLTPKGYAQIASAVHFLWPMIDFDNIVYSGELRTLQCATLAQQILRKQGTLEVCSGIHFAEVGDRLHITEESFIEENIMQ